MLEFAVNGIWTTSQVYLIILGRRHLLLQSLSICNCRLRAASPIGGGGLKREAEAHSMSKCSGNACWEPAWGGFIYLGQSSSIWGSYEKVSQKQAQAHQAQPHDTALATRLS
ncbi:hypothetical protein AOLI_G00099040 [Acnodon oligacanthus]